MAEAWSAATPLAIVLVGAALVSGWFAWRARATRAPRNGEALGFLPGAAAFARALAREEIGTVPGVRRCGAAVAPPAQPAEDARDEPVGRALESLTPEQPETALDLPQPGDDGVIGWQRLALRGRFADGQLEGFSCLARDVTRERELEQALARQRRQVQTLERALMRERDLCAQIQNGCPAFLIVLDAENRITRVNPPLCEALGYQPDELLGRNYGAALTPHASEDADARAEHPDPASLRGASGELHAVDWHWRVVRDERGLRRYRLGIGIESGPRPAPEWIAEQHGQLIETEKLLALGRLISGVAHEIGNPNHVIQINVALLEEAWSKIPAARSEEGLVAEVPQMLGEVQAASHRIQMLVGELHAYVRGEPAHSMSAVCLDDVVRSALTLIASTVRRATGRFELETAEALPPVWGDLRRLEQILINLILNASEALRRRDERICVQTAFDAERDEVVLRVVDEGIGIEPEFLSQVLDAGFTSKQKSGGKGLGLAVARCIAELHGGRIQIESEPGKGTRASLHLPAHRPEGE